MAIMQFYLALRSTGPKRTEDDTYSICLINQFNELVTRSQQPPAQLTLKCPFPQKEKNISLAIYSSCH